jgi:hypothetical protein
VGARGRKLLLIAAAAVGIWYLVVVFSWAARPLHDSVPIGIDYTVTPNKPVSQDVTCDTLFSGTSRSGDLPTLRVQYDAKGNRLEAKSQFAYQRAACDLVQRDARIVFGLDTLGAVVVEAGLLVFLFRKPTVAD